MNTSPESETMDQPSNETIEHRGVGRGRTLGVWLMLAAATALTVVACLGVWIKRQVGDTDNWATTSAELIRDPSIQAATANFLSEQVSQSPELRPLVEQVLPPRLDPLAPAIVGGLGELTDRAATRALRGDRFQRLWIESNRLAQRQFVAMLNQDTDRRAVILDLRPMLGQLAVRVGLGQTATQRLRESPRGLVTVVESDDVATLRSAARLFRSLTWAAIVLAIVLFAGAVGLARGRRARTVVAAGASLAAAGLIVLFVRRWLGVHLVDVVAADGAAIEAAQATLSIGTSLLQEAARSLVIAGVVIAAGGWLGTGARPAQALRRRLAPVAGQEPLVVFGGALLAVLVLLAWGPIPATRTWLGALLILALVLGGVAALRAQVIREAGEAAPRPAN